jgi:hypothetical protein
VYILIFNYIFPDVKEAIINKSRRQALTAQAENGIEMLAEKNYTLIYGNCALFSGTQFIGAVSSLNGRSCY